MAGFSQEKWVAILDAIEWFQKFCREHSADEIRAFLSEVSTKQNAPGVVS